MSEISIRVLVTYLCQLLVGVVLFIVFRHFSKQYKLKFLITWSWSWLGFSLYMLSLSFITILLGLDPSSPARFISSLSAQIGSFTQGTLLVLGAYELKVGKLVTRKNKILIIAVVVLSAAACIIAFNNSSLPEAANYRYILRLGLRCFVLGTGFIVAGIIIYRSSFIHQGIGLKLLVVSFLLFSITQLSYFGIILANFFGAAYNIQSYFGLVDLMSISLIGFSMVMWLLEDERARLDKANKELDSFLYTTSHDLRAPIASILGLTNLAKHDVTDSTAKEYFTMIEGRTNKLDKVISDILLLTKTIKMDLEIEPVDFNKLVAESLADSQYRKGTEKIVIKYQPKESNTFNSDYRQLKIVMDNLISNALKYYSTDQPKPYVEISVLISRNEIEIKVKDNGEGISPESSGKVFDMFYRASSKADGTGLGLYLVKEAVNKLGGKISLQSEPGVGSEFIIHLKQKS